MSEVTVGSSNRFFDALARRVTLMADYDKDRPNSCWSFGREDAEPT
jgi:hypothetical protein